MLGVSTFTQWDRLDRLMLCGPFLSCSVISPHMQSTMGLSH